MNVVYDRGRCQYLFNQVRIRIRIRIFIPFAFSFELVQKMSSEGEIGHTDLRTLYMCLFACNMQSMSMFRFQIRFSIFNGIPVCEFQLPQSARKTSRIAYILSSIRTHVHTSTVICGNTTSDEFTVTVGCDSGQPAEKENERIGAT